MFGRLWVSSLAESCGAGEGGEGEGGGGRGGEGLGPGGEGEGIIVDLKNYAPVNAIQSPNKKIKGRAII